MLPKIEDYKPIVGDEVIDKIKDLAIGLEDKHIVHINSTYYGGGVAEILNSLVVLMNQLGVKTDWRLLKGSHSFFDVTKKFHNALQGEKVRLEDNEKKIYMDELERNAITHHFHEHDLVIIHDPQPLGLINFVKKRKQPWIWRCHVDIKTNNRQVWPYLRDFANRYDGAIFSLSKYGQKSLSVPQFFFQPSIDPLTLKNMDLPARTIKKLLEKEGISTKKPIVTQISRFDKWKNPLGVLSIYNEIRKRQDAQLVLMGDTASDDPEGPKIYSKVLKQAEKMKDVTIITNKDDLLVNALQRSAHVVLQNSVREGFGLTVTEAMWKQAPVVATKVGGIPMQVINNRTGFLMTNPKEGADYCVKLLRDDKLRQRIGIAAKEHVRYFSLITRHIYDYLNLIDNYTGTVADDVMKAAKYLKRMVNRE
jgi:trehalose synthase